MRFVWPFALGLLVVVPLVAGGYWLWLATQAQVRGAVLQPVADS